MDLFKAHFMRNNSISGRPIGDDKDFGEMAPPTVRWNHVDGHDDFLGLYFMLGALGAVAAIILVAIGCGAILRCRTDGRCCWRWARRGPGASSDAGGAESSTATPTPPHLLRLLPSPPQSVLLSDVTPPLVPQRSPRQSSRQSPQRSPQQANSPRLSPHALKQECLNKQWSPQRPSSCTPTNSFTPAAPRVHRRYPSTATGRITNSQPLASTTTVTETTTPSSSPCYFTLPSKAARRAAESVGTLGWGLGLGGGHSGGGGSPALAKGCSSSSGSSRAVRAVSTACGLDVARLPRRLRPGRSVVSCSGSAAESKMRTAAVPPSRSLDAIIRVGAARVAEGAVDWGGPAAAPSVLRDQVEASVLAARRVRVPLMSVVDRQWPAVGLPRPIRRTPRPSRSVGNLTD